MKWNEILRSGTVWVCALLAAGAFVVIYACDSGNGSGDGDAPYIAGVRDVTMPVRIEESYVEPEYPELARLARIEGNVILHAVIFSDGSVGEIEVLRCTQPELGFEKAAIDAVQQWRYRPATQCGRPVSVCFTILVEFSLA